MTKSLSIGWWLIAVALLTGCSLILRPSTEPSGSEPQTSVPSQTASSPEATVEVIEASNAGDLRSIDQISDGQSTAFAWIVPQGQSQPAALAVAKEDGVEMVEPGGPDTSQALTVANQAVLMVSLPQDGQLAWLDIQGDVYQATAGETREPVQSAGIGEEQITSLAFNPVSGQLAGSSYNGQVFFWEQGVAQPVLTWDVPAWLSDLSFSPDGRQLAGVELENFTLHFYDVLNGIELRTLQWDTSVQGVLYTVVLDPSWKRVAWVSRNVIQLMDAQNGSLGPSLLHEDAVNSVSWAPNGMLLATASAGMFEGDYQPLIQLWDADSGAIVGVLALPVPVTQVSFSPDGSELAVLDTQGNLQIYAITP